MKKWSLLGHVAAVSVFMLPCQKSQAAKPKPSNAPIEMGGYSDPDLKSAIVLTPKQFGAKGDGIRDDTKAIRAMLAHRVKSDFVAYDFGSGSYRISTPGGDAFDDGITLHGTCGHILQIGGDPRSRTYKKIWLLGHGAKLLANEKNNYQMLAVILHGESLYFGGLTFQREERCLSSDNKFSGGGGVWISPVNDQVRTKEILFINCDFSNCHRAVNVCGWYYPKKVTPTVPNCYPQDDGIIGLVRYKNCSFIYPYGSNSTNLAGGDVATFQDNLVGTSQYTDCRFDGCVGGDCSISPNRFSKDGFVFDESRNLIMDGVNRLKHGGVEMVFHFPAGNAFMLDAGKAGFQIPPPGGFTTVSSAQDLQTLGIIPGQRFYYESAGKWFYFIVKQILSPHSLEIINDGSKSNSPPGSLLHSSWASYPDCRSSSRHCKISGLRVSGYVSNYGDNPPGSFHPANPAIRIDDANASVENCSLNSAIVFNSMVNQFGHPSSLIAQSTDHVFSGHVSDCDFQLLDGTRLSPLMAPSSAIGSFFYDGLRVSGCTFRSPNSSSVTFCQLWSLRNTVEKSSFAATSLTAPVIIRGRQSSCGVMIGNVGTGITQANAPLIQDCTFSNLQQGVTTTTGQSNRGSLGPAPSYADSNTYINVPHPYLADLYNRQKVIGWQSMQANGSDN